MLRHGEESFDDKHALELSECRNNVKWETGVNNSFKRFQLSIVFPKDLESILVSRREVDANVTLTEMIA